MSKNKIWLTFIGLGLILIFSNIFSSGGLFLSSNIGIAIGIAAIIFGIAIKIRNKK